jgi:hypothetical protein
MTNFTRNSGHPPALVRVWYSLNADGRAPLVSKWIAIPHAHSSAHDAAHAQDVCAVHLCSIELRTAAPSESGAPPCEEFDDPGPSFTFSHVVTRA